MDDTRRDTATWITYPPARRSDQADDYYGTRVADPYRWLEDEKSGETLSWLKAQKEIANRFFAEIPERAAALESLRKNWLDGVGSLPAMAGRNRFFFRSVPGQPHMVLYVQKGKGAAPEIAFDLNANNPDGLRTIWPMVTASPSGRYAAYFINYAGGDNPSMHLLDAEAGRELDEVFPPSYFLRQAWLPDESGFFYYYLDHDALLGGTGTKRPGIYLHRLGTPVRDDALEFDQPWVAQRTATPYVVKDRGVLLIHHLHIMGSRGGWGVRSLSGGQVTWLIAPDVEYRFAFIGVAGSEVFLVTDYGAPNWRIVACDLSRPGLENLREVVPQGKQPISMLGGLNVGLVVLHQGLLYITYIDHSAHAIRIFDLQGAPNGEIPLPDLSAVTGIRTNEQEPEMLIGIESFLMPGSTYSYDAETRSLTPYERTETPARFADYQVKRVFYSSQDGTRIPMCIVQRKGLKLDGSARVLLYGYGGWGVPWLPRFENHVIQWLDWGGVYAVANLRGGSEYGEEWHKAGQLYNKQNVFDDFCAAARHLVREGYSTHSRITIMGASNGGLLTAACYNQHPELFGAVISHVAAIDLLRLQNTPLGATVTVELGSPAMGKEMFEYLLNYSPLHNVRHEGAFPPILNITGENDLRCTPGHIYKFVAELQRVGDPKRVVILRVVEGSGHGSSNRDDQAAYLADQLAFAWAMT